ncbi:MAG: DEAD/DEAH box helicase [Vicinamibacterales bacterium]
MTLRPSDIVRARHSTWRVVSIGDAADGCRAIRLARLAPHPYVLRTLVEPFDRLQRLDRAPRPFVVSRAAATTRLLLLGTEDTTWTTPLAAADAAIDLLDWQLVPSMVALSGEHRRILLADDVGSGKTIQAGLLIRELQRRWPDGRVLILTPAGLRLQWRRELEEKLNIQSQIVDLAWLTSRMRLAPHGLNPWTEAAVAISSLDFAKQQEVLPGPDQLVWNALIVDEAHAIGPGTARAALAHTVGRRARHVLLLTATPHDGIDRHYENLCGLAAGRNEAPLLVLRRSVALTPSSLVSRQRVMQVRPSAGEQSMHAILERYLCALSEFAVSHDAPQTALLAHVLRKRAASSVSAVMESLLKRRRWLQDAPTPVPATVTLPFDDDAADDDAESFVQVPGLVRTSIELACLGASIDAARTALTTERKVVALHRLLARVGEPVIVFTEFRDTLLHLARALRGVGHVELLHGGLASFERQAAIERFTTGRSRVLLATDAASEGLNLHHRCRLVILFDQPWVPTRVAQRIGRVSRFGQTRRVHVIHLTSDTPFDRTLTERLHDRAIRARDALAPCVESDRTGGYDTMSHVELARLLRRRELSARLARLHVDANTPSTRCSRRGAIALTCFPPSSSAKWSGALVVLDAELSSNEGCIDRTLVAAHVPLRVPALRSRAALRLFTSTFLASTRDAAVRAVRQHLAARWAVSAATWRAYRLAVSRADDSGASAPQQLPLFGSRSARRAAAPDDATVDRTGVGDAVHERIDVTMVLLREGRGHLSVTRT